MIEDHGIAPTELSFQFSDQLTIKDFVLVDLESDVILGIGQTELRIKLLPIEPQEPTIHTVFGAGGANSTSGVVFISYSREDVSNVITIVDELERFGIRTWLDTRREADQQRFAAAIVRAIRSSSVCAFMCSSNSYHSDHVARELNLAAKYRKSIVPIEIEKSIPTEEFEYYFCGLDFIPVKPIDHCIKAIKQCLQSTRPFP